MEVRLRVFLEALGIKESDLSPVPVHLRLAVAATGFWMREARPGPSQSHLQALVLGMVYGELSWKTESGATHRQHASEFPAIRLSVVFEDSGGVIRVLNVSSQLHRRTGLRSAVC